MRDIMYEPKNARKEVAKIDTYHEKSFYETLLSSEYPRENISNHESDMYVYVTPLTTKLVKEFWPDDGMRELFVKKFKDNVTGRHMYDIAFAYDPYWKDKKSEVKK